MKPKFKSHMSKKELRLFIDNLEMNIRAGFDTDKNQKKLDDIMSKLNQGVRLKNGIVSSVEDLQDTYAPFSSPDGSTDYVFNKIEEDKRVKITQKILLEIIKDELKSVIEEKLAAGYALNDKGEYEKIMSVPVENPSEVAPSDSKSNKDLAQKAAERGYQVQDANKYEQNIRKIKFDVDDPVTTAAMNIISVFDVTGVSAWPSLAAATRTFKTNKTWYNAFRLSLAAADVLPVVGRLTSGVQKAGKIAKAVKNLSVTMKNSRMANKALKASAKTSSTLSTMDTALSINALRTKKKKPLKPSQKRLLAKLTKKQQQPDSDNNLMSIDNNESLIQKKAVSQNKYKPKNVQLKQIQSLVGAEPTGKYNNETYEKIVAFQKKVGSKPDGVFGNNTLLAYKKLYNRNRRVA